MVRSGSCFTAGVITALLLASGATGLSAQVNAELDAYWAEVSRTVQSGDFDGYSALYHPDAVLISGDASQPISDALAGWKPGFEDTLTGLIEASVQFRFSERRNDATTAHETGIFRYETVTPSDDGSVQYIHFEALLVERDGWKMLMEFQRSPATRAEWEALERGGSEPDRATALMGRR